MILVAGSRSWGDIQPIRDRLSQLPPKSEIIHGGAQGADTIAAYIAGELGFKIKCFLPDWKQHGRKAGLVRNIEMLNQAPDLVIAFWDGTSTGTKHTIDEGRKRGIKVEVHSLPE